MDNNLLINKELFQTIIGKALDHFYRSLVFEFDSLTIKTVLRQKNLYLLRIKYKQGASQIVNALLLTYLASFEATIFGNYFEPLMAEAMPKHNTELAGQDFWEELTGDPEFYLKLIHFIDRLPKTHIDAFEAAYQKAENRLIKEFTQLFCGDDGSIDWDALVRFNSGR